MRLGKKLALFPFIWGFFGASIVFADPPGSGSGGGGQIVRNPGYPTNIYPIVVPNVNPVDTSPKNSNSTPAPQGGSSVTNGNKTINANGTSCVVNPNGKKICN